MDETTTQSAAPTEGEMLNALRCYVANFLQKRTITVTTKAQVDKLNIDAEHAIRDLEEKLAEYGELVRQWVNANPDRFKKTRKILIYGGHKIGFQKTRGSIEVPDVPAFVERAENFGLSELVTVKKSPNGTGIADYRKRAEQPEITDNFLRTLGCVFHAGEDTVVIDVNLPNEAPQ